MNSNLANTVEAIKNIYFGISNSEINNFVNESPRRARTKRFDEYLRTMICRGDVFHNY